MIANTPMLTLKDAKRIAGRVGARIQVFSEDTLPDSATQEVSYQVTIAGRSFRSVDGEEMGTVFWASTPREAAHVALVETGRFTTQLIRLCKQLYVDENLLFRVD